MAELRTQLSSEACVAALSDIGDGHSLRQVIQDDSEGLFRGAETRRALYKLGSELDRERFAARSRSIELRVLESPSDDVIETVELPPIDGAVDGSPRRCKVHCSMAPASPGVVGSALSAESPDQLPRCMSAPITPCAPVEPAVKGECAPAGFGRTRHGESSATLAEGPKGGKRSAPLDVATAGKRRSRGAPVGQTPVRLTEPASRKA